MTVLLAFGADLAWNLAGAFWGFSLLALLVVWVALHQLHATTANTSKTSAVETRLNAHVVAAAPAINLQANGGTVGGSLVVAGDNHVQGTLYGTSGTLTVGDQAQFTASGNGPTGSNTFLGLTNSQASFLASLSQMSTEGTQPLDPNTGSTWATGERDYINNAVGAINNLISRLQSNGYMN
jgi:hypothetical protein